MKEVGKSIYVGSDADCFCESRNEWAVIHACKTCHKRKIGYSGNLDQSHLFYLIMRDQNHLFLNLVDMDRTLMPVFTNPIMKAALEFIHENIGSKRILIHCNEGCSRAPSIALLYLARESLIPNADYEEARVTFLRNYPTYLPARGIESYMRQNWIDLLKL
jgi:hypothetical protein